MHLVNQQKFWGDSISDDNLDDMLCALKNLLKAQNILDFPKFIQEIGVVTQNKPAIQQKFRTISNNLANESSYKVNHKSHLKDYTKGTETNNEASNVLMVFRFQLRQKKWQRRPCGKDGNCLFRAIAYIIYGTEGILSYFC